MKTLLATDGSELSRRAVEAVARWPAYRDAEVRVISVAHARVPAIPEPTMFGEALHEESLDNARQRASAEIDWTVDYLKEHAPDLKLSQAMPEGSPKKKILDEAERWGADLIVLGSRGRGPIERFLLGSVSHSVALQAPCSVNIIRN